MSEQTYEQEDVDDDLAVRSASLAFSAAGRLHAVSSTILGILSALTLAGIGVSVVLLLTANTSGERVSACVAIAASIVAWLVGALTCFAGQALARYIEFRVDTTG